MPNKGSQDELTIRRMPDGGYLVMRYGYAGERAEMLFASADLVEALGYIGDQVKVIGGTEEPKENPEK